MGGGGRGTIPEATLPSAERWSHFNVMLIIVRGSVTRTCPKSNVSEEKGVSVDSNRRPSAYQHSSVPARPHLVGVRDIISGAVNT